MIRLAILCLVVSGGPKVKAVVTRDQCLADSDCEAPRRCGCNVRVSCSYLRPGTFFWAADGGTSTPGAARCMTLEEAVEARAVRMLPSVATRTDCDAGCYPWIPDCESDKECPRGQVCVCSGPECSVQRRVIPELPTILRPPYSTHMCMPPPSPDSGITY